MRRRPGVKSLSAAQRYAELIGQLLRLGGGEERSIDAQQLRTVGSHQGQGSGPVRDLSDLGKRGVLAAVAQAFVYSVVGDDERGIAQPECACHGESEKI